MSQRTFTPMQSHVPSARISSEVKIIPFTGLAPDSEFSIRGANLAQHVYAYDAICELASARAMALWPSGLRRCTQVLDLALCGLPLQSRKRRGFESHRCQLFFCRGQFCDEFQANSFGA